MCDSCKLLYLKSNVLENANFWPISQICYFQDRLITFFVTDDRPVFALNYVSNDDFDHSGDMKFDIVFASYTICLLTTNICCIWKNVYYKSQKND